MGVCMSTPIEVAESEKFITVSNVPTFGASRFNPNKRQRFDSYEINFMKQHGIGKRYSGDFFSKGVHLMEYKDYENVYPRTTNVTLLSDVKDYKARINKPKFFVIDFDVPQLGDRVQLEVFERKDLRLGGTFARKNGSILIYNNGNIATVEGRAGFLYFDINTVVKYNESSKKWESYILYNESGVMKSEEKSSDTEYAIAAKYVQEHLYEILNDIVIVYCLNDYSTRFVSIRNEGVQYTMSRAMTVLTPSIFGDTVEMYGFENILSPLHKRISTVRGTNTLEVYTVGPAADKAFHFVHMGTHASPKGVSIFFKGVNPPQMILQYHCDVGIENPARYTMSISEVGSCFNPPITTFDDVLIQQMIDVLKPMFPEYINYDKLAIIESFSGRNAKFDVLKDWLYFVTWWKDRKLKPETSATQQLRYADAARGEAIKNALRDLCVVDTSRRNELLDQYAASDPLKIFSELISSESKLINAMEMSYQLKNHAEFLGKCKCYFDSKFIPSNDPIISEYRSYISRMKSLAESRLPAILKKETDEDAYMKAVKRNEKEEEDRKNAYEMNNKADKLNRRDREADRAMSHAMTEDQFIDAGRDKLQVQKEIKKHNEAVNSPYR